jgi:hypothetical protein
MGVIPFYYEVREGKQWVVEFCKDFYLTFVYQYIAFKTRKPHYLSVSQKEQDSFASARHVAREEGLDYLVEDLEGVEMAVNRKSVDTLWNMVRDAPRLLATRQQEFMVQILDEFQFLNSEIYRDQEVTHVMDDLASGYMITAEYKNAPLLVSGSWVGWLFNLLNRMTGRFQMDFLEPLPEDESIEMVFKYAQFENIPITEATAYLMAKFCEGNPAYISALIRSRYPGKDLTTEDGVLHTLEFETRDERGAIKRTWLEYLYSALPRISERYAKQIILYLCKHKDQKVSRQELLKNLNLEMTEEELTEKMEALIRSDIINRGGSSVRYQAVQDNLFDKVFRGEFGGDIEEFDERAITNEYKTLFEEIQGKYRALLGTYNQAKGAFAEYQILKILRTAYRHQEQVRSMIRNLPDRFQFVEYESVWSYYGTAQGHPDFQVDIFARPKDGIAIIGEVKNREADPFSGKEAREFVEKMATLKELEQITDAIGLVYSRSGFRSDALTVFAEHQIAYSDDERWLD